MHSPVLVHATESIVVDENKKLKAAVLATKVFSEATPGTNPIVGIFPEGTRSKDGQPLPAISGASWIARKAGMPILPVALCGFWEAWPPATPLPRWKRKHLGIHFLKPINPADFPDDQAATDFALSEIYNVVLRERATASTSSWRSWRTRGSDLLWIVPTQRKEFFRSRKEEKRCSILCAWSKIAEKAIH